VTDSIEDTDQVIVNVVSKANPPSQDLIQARAMIQARASLQDIFRQADDEKWMPSMLASMLAPEIQDLVDPEATAHYLADEYSQLGSGHVMLVSTETGRVQVVLQEQDIYLPAPVPREGTDKLAQPGPRIRPDIEAGIISWFHNNGRDSKVLTALQARTNQTDIMRDMGDSRLLVATRRGRRHIVDSLAKYEPGQLLKTAGGRAGQFLQFFKILEEPDPKLTQGLQHLVGSATAQSIMGVQDALTTNLHHNKPATLRGSLVAGWLRHIAVRLAYQIYQAGTPIHLDCRQASQLPSGFWLASPDMIRPFHKIDPRVEVLPIESPHSTLINGPVGYLWVPPKFKASSREIGDRWETYASLDYEMWVDPQHCQAYEILGVEIQTQVYPKFKF